jgi:hypothetical protein
MYLGWNFCEKALRSIGKKTAESAGFSFLKSAAICRRIESLTTTTEGEKLKEAPGAVGAGLLQLIRQQAQAALKLAAPWQFFAFFLQHSIADIPPEASPAKTGVPASTPEASARSRKADVRYFFIFKFSVFRKLLAVSNRFRRQFPFNQTVLRNDALLPGKFGDDFFADLRRI